VAVCVSVSPALVPVLVTSPTAWPASLTVWSTVPDSGALVVTLVPLLGRDCVPLVPGRLGDVTGAVAAEVVVDVEGAAAIAEPPAVADPPEVVTTGLTLTVVFAERCAAA